MSAPGSSRHSDFLRLFTVTEPALRAFVRSLLPTLEDTQDVMQEIAVVLWEKFATYPTTEDFRRWAFGVAKWKVLSWQRDKGRDRHVFGLETTELLARDAEDATDTLEVQREALRVCLQRLRPVQRDLVQRAYEPEARIDQLAASLGMTAMALYKKLHRIRMLLVECTKRVSSLHGKAL